MSNDSNKRNLEVTWQRDTLLAGFECRTLPLTEDAEGENVATLVRRRPEEPEEKEYQPKERAVLYLHGFNDYFFQAHLAEEFEREGFAFYALDLRKYGRSLRPRQTAFFCRDIREYYEEITSTIRILKQETGVSSLVLLGHSTGGLIASLYVYEGEERGAIDALVLNSPFFDFNRSRPLREILSQASHLGKVSPFAVVEGANSPLYAQSLHRDYHGEWQFDTRLKRITPFAAHWGWIRAIVTAQQRVRQGLSLEMPILVLHSDHSVYGTVWSPAFLSGDAVLNVEHIRQGTLHLGRSLTLITVPNGLHDLALSACPVREFYMKSVLQWLRSMPIDNEASTRQEMQEA
jgi:alpha-beta hydrolase superfamily lysophospholipase